MLKNKFDIFIFSTVVLMVFMFVYSLYAIPVYYSSNLQVKNTDPYIFLKENSEEDACIMDISNQGATIEVFSKRYYFFHSLGGSGARGAVAAHVLLLNDIDPKINHLYVLLNYADIYKINQLNTNLGLEEIGFYRTATTDAESDLNVSEIKEELGSMKEIFVANNLIINETGLGCAYVAPGDIFYFKNGVCNTTIFKMITNQSVKNFKNIYFKDGYTIYKYTLNAS